MNYQQNGMLSGLSPQQQEYLSRLMQYLNQSQQEPMLTGPMMIAQNQLQKMFGGPSDVMSPKERLAYCQADPEGVGCERFKGNAAPVQTGYSLGKEAPGQLELEQRQRNESAAKLGLPPGKNYSDDDIRAATLRKRSAVR